MSGLDSTVAVKVRLALRGGTPSSVTLTVMLLVVSESESLVGHVKMPLTAPTVAAGGAPASREKVRLLGGKSGSEALFVN